MTSPVITPTTPRRAWITSGISPLAAAAAAIAILALGGAAPTFPRRSSVPTS